MYSVVIGAEVGAACGVGVVNMPPESLAKENVVVLSSLLCRGSVCCNLVVVVLEMGVGDNEVLSASP